MENSDKARSETSSESEAGELQEEWPVVLDEVRHLETAKGSFPLEVLDNRPLYAPVHGAKLERFFAALSNQTAATKAEERDDLNSSYETGSFVRLGRTGVGWSCAVTYLLTYPMLPLRCPALVIDDVRSLHAANEIVPLHSDVYSSPPKHYGATARAIATNLPALTPELLTKTWTDLRNEELEKQYVVSKIKRRKT